MIKIRKGNIGYDKRQKELDAKIFLVEEQSEEEVRIENLIREKYSLSQELALHRKKAMGSAHYSKAEWDEYCSYVEECIERARANS